MFEFALNVEQNELLKILSLVTLPTFLKDNNLKISFFCVKTQGIVIPVEVLQEKNIKKYYVFMIFRFFCKNCRRDFWKIRRTVINF